MRKIKPLDTKPESSMVSVSENLVLFRI